MTQPISPNSTVTKDVKPIEPINGSATMTAKDKLLAEIAALEKQGVNLANVRLTRIDTQGSLMHKNSDGAKVIVVSQFLTIGKASVSEATKGKDKGKMKGYIRYNPYSVGGNPTANLASRTSKLSEAESGNKPYLVGVVPVYSEMTDWETEQHLKGIPDVTGKFKTPIEVFD